MKELVINCNEKKHTCQLPENFSEMNDVQFIEAVKYRINKLAEKPTTDTFFTNLCGIDPHIVKQLPSYHKYSIEQLFEYILEKDLNIAFKAQKIPKIKIEETEYYGYWPDFENTTWEEFILADQFFMDNDYKSLISLLYRQKRENHDGETDIRIPFTKYGILKRLTIVNKLDETTILALALQYKAMRQASLEQKYTQIFPEHIKFEDDEKQEPEAQNKFSWLQVHRNILGDNIAQEKEYLQLNVHTVLHRLNTAIIESKKRKTA
jgi:hypothetical protein